MHADKQVSGDNMQSKAYCLPPPPQLLCPPSHAPKHLNQDELCILSLLAAHTEAATRGYKTVFSRECTSSFGTYAKKSQWKLNQLKPRLQPLAA